MRSVLLAVALLATAAADAETSTATDSEAKITRLVAGRVAGAPRSCIPQLRDIRSFQIPRIGMVYDVGATRYLMRFEGGCQAMTIDTNTISMTPTEQLCAGDIARIVTSPPPSIDVGSCTFGKFVPYTRAKQASK